MKTILIADDNAVSRELMREILELGHYIVAETPDGEKTLEMLGRDRPDALLLDIQMPGADGFEVLRRIRRTPALENLKVAAITAYAMRGDREKAMAAGFDGYITKPVEVDDLLNAVAELLES